jgi:site-specific recombinase XerD
VPYIGLYRRDIQRRGLRPRSIQRLHDILGHLDTHTGRRLVELTTDDIYQWLEAVPRTARTRYAYISAVHRFFCWAIAEGYATENPAAGIPRPRIHPGLPRPIAAPALSTALLHASPMVKAWLLLAALDGLRCQEIAGIEREHVWDHEEPPLLHVVAGKGGHERVVPLHPQALAALRTHGLPRSGPVFRAPTTGRAYTPERVSQLTNRHLRSVGVDATMHQLRHRFATDLYRASRDLRLTQMMLGHASPVTTAIYTEVSPVDAAHFVGQLKA